MNNLNLNASFNSAIVDPERFDDDQIQELKEIFNRCNRRLFLFLANHPEIGSDCLWEILQFSNEHKNNSETIIGNIIQVLGVYTGHIKDKGISCCCERIRYGLYAIDSKMGYPYTNYLMCTPAINKKNIKDVYACFKSNITLTRISETIPIPMYSVYTPDQVTQICKSLIEIQAGECPPDFLHIIKSPINSAHDMLVIRREAKKIAKSLKIINEINKTNMWIRVEI